MRWTARLIRLLLLRAGSTSRPQSKLKIGQGIDPPSASGARVSSYFGSVLRRQTIPGGA